MRKLRSLQARTLRRSIALRTAGLAAAYSVAYFVLAVTVLPWLFQQAAYVVADVTSPWEYVTEDEFNDLQGLAGMGYWSGNGLYAVRSLQTYDTFRAMTDDLTVALYFVGVVIIVALAAGRALGRFDELSLAVTTLFADRLAPIELPDELAATRAELTQIQNRALSDERAAKAAEQRKNELVAYLAHDIRTPLTSVIGYLSILKESPELPVEARAKYAGIACEKAERLESLVGEFFEITRYDLHAIPIERERVDLRIFCEQVADELFPEAQAKGLDIRVDAPEGECAFVDAEKMARAVLNVLKNAVAYANPGSAVEVRAGVAAGGSTADEAKLAGEAAGETGKVDDAPTGERRRANGAPAGNRGHAGGVAATQAAPDAAESESAAAAENGRTDDACPAGKAFIEIENEGKEISPAHLQSIFEKFFREDGARGSGKGGAGLGLAIAKEIVEAHGGSIAARSERGRTVFTIVFPR